MRFAKGRIDTMGKTKMAKRRVRTGLLFISPWLAGGLVLFVWPVLYSVVLSLTDFNVDTEQGVSFYNYTRAFATDLNFMPMLGETMQNVLLNLPLINIFSFFIALLLNTNLKLRGVFRSIFFLPVMLGTGFVMQQLLSQNISEESMNLAMEILLPKTLQSYIGTELTELAVGFLTRITGVMWHSGVQILLYLTGLQGISSSIYEAASIDAADSWQTFWLITLPMMTPIILLNVIYTIVSFFSDASNGVIEYILLYGFGRSDFGYAAAIGWIYFGCSFLLILLMWGILNHFVKKTVA